jgi:hypothetical protein
MVLTINKQKERYYELVVEKANKICSSWVKTSTRSKQIVAKAMEYAFDKRLKTDVKYRFQVLAFAVALKMRFDKRYSGFWHKLIFLFSYLRERNALNVLKSAGL